MNNNWFSEGLSSGVEPENVKISWKIKKVLYSGQSQYQKIEFFDSYDHGIMFTLDDLVMVTERDEFIYHEMLSHVPLYTHESPKKALVIGGGDMGMIREIIKHPSIEEAHLCEIDELVIEKCKEFYPYVQEVIDNPKVSCFIEDGFNFLEKNKNTYDIIITDSTDPIGEAAKLFSTEYIQLCHDSLSENGILAMQSGSPFYNTDTIVEMNGIYNNIFPLSSIYTASTHSYPGGFWGFCLGSKKFDPIKDFQKERYNRDNLDLKYYNEEIHSASFALPNYLRKKIKA